MIGANSILWGEGKGMTLVGQGLRKLVRAFLFGAILGLVGPASMVEGAETKGSRSTAASQKTKEKAKEKKAKKAKPAKAAKGQKKTKGKSKVAAKAAPAKSRRAQAQPKSHAPAPVPSDPAAGPMDIPHEEKDDLPPPQNTTPTE
jgi:hypothetical protein